MAITFEWCLGGFFGSDSMTYEIGGGNYTAGSFTYENGTIRKTGGASFYVSGSNNATYARKATTASRQKRTGAFFHLLSLPASSSERLLTVADSSVNHLAEVRIKSNGDLALFVGGSEQDTYAACPVSTWRHIGMDVKIDNAAGWAYVYLDGVEIMSFSGNTGNADVAYVYTGSGPIYCTYYLDDWYCEDTAGEGAAAPVPLRYFDEMTISGAGNYAQFTPSAGSNYACMDEVPPNEDTDYVSATSTDKIDSYATTDLPLKYGLTCNAVHAGAIAKKLGVAATQVKPFMRENSTDWEGTAQNCNSDYTYHTERRALCPDGTAWDQAGLNGLEVGLKSAGAYA